MHSGSNVRNTEESSNKQQKKFVSIIRQLKHPVGRQIERKKRNDFLFLVRGRSAGSREVRVRAIEKMIRCH